MIKQQIEQYKRWAIANDLKANDYKTLKNYCYLLKQGESKQGGKK